ncbi:Cmx/CmrA family chloramphenicol efflux MFS transporter [Streptomyces sp. NPDC053499]|uniref:Cmx/CmrA family chloramphenicol efflux MFS transporter n=1 Tax=Streptomyces sp. NPDC053499 TaxID=3365707 RepID=UPI0037D4CADA
MPGDPVDGARSDTRIPFSVYVLGLSVFALGTSEFMLSGILQPLARDLGVSIPQAGLLVSAFAVGMVVGAPVLAAATLRLPRRTTLIALLAAFALGHVVGALAPTYEVLFVSRIVSALACAGFWAVGSAVAVSLVPGNARARAMAIMVGGLSVANIAGVPAGSFLGQQAGWRAAFWAVAVLAALAVAGVLASVPDTPVPTGAQAPDLRRELRIYRDKQVWLALVTIALNAGAVFAFFSYLAPLLTEVAGVPESWVPSVLALFGLGGLIGTVIGGRIADAHLFGTMYGGIAASATVLTLLALLAEYRWAAIALALVLGVTAFTTGPALNARMFNAAEAAPTLAGATATASFNIGNTVGPWVGGLAISAGWGYAAVAWVGTAMAASAVLTTAISSRVRSRALPRRGLPPFPSQRRAPHETCPAVPVPAKPAADADAVRRPRHIGG